LGIGDWAQSPIPNPQSPFLRNDFLVIYYRMYFKIKRKEKIYKNN